MFSLPCILPKTTSNFGPSKFSRANYVHFLTIKIMPKKVNGNNVDISTREITSKKVRGNNVDISTNKITSIKYVETTWTFRPEKLCRIKYVEPIRIFRSAKLHQESTWKWHGNSSRFSFWHIGIISTSYWLRFDMVCPLGYFILKALFAFKIFKFLSWLFGHVEKAGWLER